MITKDCAAFFLVGHFDFPLPGLAQMVIDKDEKYFLTPIAEMQRGGAEVAQYIRHIWLVR